MAKILLKHKHLDNEGKLELLHMMSNVMSRNKIGLHNAQGKIKSSDELKLKDPRCRIQCPDILPENTGVAVQCKIKVKCRSEAAGSTMSDTMSRTSCPKILDT